VQFGDFVFSDASELQFILCQIERCPYVPPVAQCAVESHAEPDRGLVTDGRVHTDATVDDPRDCLGLSFRMAGIQHHEADIILEHTEKTDKAFLAHRLGLAPVAHENEVRSLDSIVRNEVPNGP
jgi:hypothetical protein